MWIWICNEYTSLTSMNKIILDDWTCCWNQSYNQSKNMMSIFKNGINNFFIFKCSVFFFFFLFFSSFSSMALIYFFAIISGFLSFFFFFFWGKTIVVEWWRFRFFVILHKWQPTSIVCHNLNFFSNSDNCLIDISKGIMRN